MRGSVPRRHPPSKEENAFSRAGSAAVPRRYFPGMRGLFVVPPQQVLAKVIAEIAPEG
jgi:hypothetical protein